MTNKKGTPTVVDKKRCLISKYLKQVAPSGQAFHEQTVTIEGETLTETKEIFDKVWEKDLWKKEKKQ